MMNRHSRVPGSLLVGGFALAVLGACSSGGGAEGTSGGGNSPPTAGTVRDGLANDIDTQTATTAISANWTGFVGNDGPIIRYEWAIGTTTFGTQVQNWTSVGTATTATNSTVSLSTNTTYFVSVKAVDSFGNSSAPACSDGVQIQATGGGGGGGGGGGSTPGMASSVSQWGITWTFDHAYPTGQFCNGDWWVVGPVTITNITPGSQNSGGRIINGSTINPSTNCDHGYDSTLFGTYKPEAYKSNLNVGLNLPLVVQPSSSLISTISQMGPAPSGSVSQLRTAAVLTVLVEAPVGDAFRPPYSGTDKTIRYRESQLDYTAFASLTPASGMPSIESTAEGLQRVWLDHCADWVSRYMHPAENMPDYYREFTALLGTAGLQLNCNFTNAQKRDLLVRFVQVGIDHYGNMVNGARWGVNGHCNGRKFPILLAGRVLQDAAMMAAGTTYRTIFNGPGAPGNNKAPFSEDGQTFYVQQTSPGVYNWGYGGYNASHLNMPEWGNFHTDSIASDSVVWDLPYRVCCSANGWIGQTLTMRIMGMQSLWNQPAYFDYVDRYVQIMPDGDWQESWTPWHGSMWHTYRSQF